MRPVHALTLAAVLGLSACSSSSTPQASPPSPTAAAPTTAAPTAAATTAAPAAAPLIQINKFAYNELTVLPGTTITVKNLDEPEHDVTSDTAGLFKAADIGQGKSVTFTAPSKPGTYTFHCSYHASMHGTLVVS